MSFSNKDRVAVVTGAAQGIGLAVAEKLASQGCGIALWDRDESLAAQSAAKISADHGVKTEVVTVEMSDPESVAAAAKSTMQAFGRIDIGVNSAGIAGPNAIIDDYGIEDWLNVQNINLNGTFYVMRALLPIMKKQNYGRFVAIASIAGKEGNPNASAYSASKAGVIALTKSAGKETAGYDIAVNCVTPAAAKTQIFDQMSQEHIDYMLSKIPRNRFLLVEEAAEMIAWLCSAENSFTTGAVFDLSGGRATY